MDEQDLLHLSAAQQQQYAIFEELFATEGWKQFSEYVAQRSELAEQALLHAATWEEHRISTGARVAYGEVLQFQAGLAAEFATKAEEQRETATIEELEDDTGYQS